MDKREIISAGGEGPRSGESSQASRPLLFILVSAAVPDAGTRRDSSRQPVFVPIPDVVRPDRIEINARRIGTTSHVSE